VERTQKIWAAVKEAHRNHRKLGCALVDREGKILDCTAAFAELLEQDVSELLQLGATIFSIGFPEDEHKTRLKLEWLFDTKSPGHISTIEWYKGAQGQRLPRQLESQAIEGADGNRHCCISIVFEVPKTAVQFTQIRTELSDVSKRLDGIVKSQESTVGGITVVAGTNTHNQADRGSSISNTQNSNTIIIVAFLALAVIVAVVFGARVFMTPTSVEVNQPPAVESQDEEP